MRLFSALVDLSWCRGDVAARLRGGSNGVATVHDPGPFRGVVRGANRTLGLSDCGVSAS